jgi:ABC-type transport system substrate-binding protein/tetratricopeptide (TPR) repeat protein
MIASSRQRGLMHLLLRGAFLSVIAASGIAVLAPLPAADEPGAKKRPVEDEDEAKPKKKVEVEDEEKPRKVVRVDEDDEKKPRPKVAGTQDLGKAAQLAKHPGIKELFSSLAVPADEVTLYGSKSVKVAGEAMKGGTVRVAPLPDYYANVGDLKKSLTIKRLSASGEEAKPASWSPAQVMAIRYYEQLAVERVKGFLGTQYATYGEGDPRYLPRYEQLLAAEQALSWVLRFHQSAREREVRKGAGWDKLETELRQSLLEVLLLELDELKKFGAWNQAFALARRMAETYTSQEDREAIATPLAKLLESALKANSSDSEKMKEARQRLKQLEDQFPSSSKVLKPLRDSLQRQAEGLYEKAKDLVNEGKEAEALPFLHQAQEIYPELPGLRALLIATDRSYQILRVHMREQPILMSPARATTDSERRVVDLLFESLENLLPDDRGLLYYRPALAVGRPKVLPLGREFKLPRNAVWVTNGEEGKAVVIRSLTGGDVRQTVQWVKKGEATGRCPLWGDLLETVRVDDPYRVKLMMRHGLLDPLSAMSFKIVPMHRPEPTTEAFAKAPVSSGPFYLAGTSSEKGVTYTALKANPYYGVRSDKPGRPFLKEIRIFNLPDPVKALQGPNPVEIDLAMDLTAEQMAKLKNGGGVDAPLPVGGAQNRRIYFLAVNQRSPSVLADANLRVALARAINREQLLDEHFRKELGRKVHRALNGPYPAGSWACNPALVSRKDKNSLDPWDEALARTKLKQAGAKLGNREVQITLKYPSGDPDLAKAMVDLCAKVSKTLEGVKLVAKERSPSDLREDVEERHDYQLAYYSYEYPSESYWLMPLLGPSGKDGELSYLGYNGALVGRITAATSLRNFAQVREFAHAIHRQMLESEMPLIPLWQLDPLFAYRSGRLTTPPVDPNRLFAQGERWRIGAGGKGVGKGE